MENNAQVTGFTPIKYIGKRASIKDSIYGTNISWDQGGTKLVPIAAAVKMLKHVDVYALGEAIEGQLPESQPVKKDETPDEKTQGVRDTIANMGKAALTEMADAQYRIKLDKSLSVAAMRARVTQLVDQYGA
jgi:hypothetical protein